MNYRHILFVTDLNKDNQIVADRTKDVLAHSPGAKLSVIHVVLDNIIAGGYEIMPLFNFSDQKQDIKEDHQLLKQFLEKAQLKADNSEIVTALSTTGGIQDYANEHQVDLIVIGLHKKTGLLNSLLGNTASSLLNNTDCDVLTVMIPPAK